MAYTCVSSLASQRFPPARVESSESKQWRTGPRANGLRNWNALRAPCKNRPPSLLRHTAGPGLRNVDAPGQAGSRQSRSPTSTPARVSPLVRRNLNVGFPRRCPQNCQLVARVLKLPLKQPWCQLEVSCADAATRGERKGPPSALPGVPGSTRTTSILHRNPAANPAVGARAQPVS